MFFSLYILNLSVAFFVKHFHYFLPIFPELSLKFIVVISMYIILKKRYDQHSKDVSLCYNQQQLTKI